MAIEKDIVEKRTEIELFNPFHDKSGRFSRKRGGGSSTTRGAVKTAKKELKSRSKKQKAGIIGAGVAGAAGGAVVGSIAGDVVGGVTAAVVHNAFGLDAKSAMEVGQIAQVFVIAVGATKGATIAAKAAKKRQDRKASDVTDDLTLADKSAIQSILVTFEAFLKRKEKRFAVLKSNNPSFAKMGFKPEGKYLYADRPHIEKLVVAINKLLKG